MSVNEDAEKLYRELCKLQNMTQAYHDWKEYRDKVSEYILMNTQREKTIAIVGAGRCNDIDLEAFSRSFSKITLIDIDEIAIKDALRNHSVEASSNIEIIVQDFVGIKEDDYIDFATILCKDIKQMKTFFSPMVTAPKMISKLDSVYENIRPYKLDLGEKKYDYVVSLGVHSQLNGMFEWMWSSMIRSFNKTNKTVATRVSQENEYIVNKFDNALYKMAKEKMFIGCEYEIVGLNCNVQGANIGIQNIEKYGNQGIIKLTDWLDTIWPFDKKQNLQYKMAISNIKILK